MMTSSLISMPRSTRCTVHMSGVAGMTSWKVTSDLSEPAVAIARMECVPKGTLVKVVNWSRGPTCRMRNTNRLGQVMGVNLPSMITNQSHAHLFNYDPKDI